MTASRPLVVLSALLGGISWFLASSHKKKQGARKTPYGNDMPDVVHAVLNEEQLKPGRLVIVGDVHGCHTELLALLDRLHFSAADDNLLLLGDLVAKGPDSIKVLRELASRGAHSVRGNHDDSALSWYRRTHNRSAAAPPPAAAPLAAAPSAAVPAASAAPPPPAPPPLPPDIDRTFVAELSAADVAFLSALPFTLSLPSHGLLLVHAGMVPGVPLAGQALVDLYKMRELVAAPGTPGGWVTCPKGTEGAVPWAFQWMGPQHIMFGHDAKRALQLGPHATGLDSACVYGGQLTAAVVPPLSVLRSAGSQSAFCAKVAAGRPLTREDLQVQLVAVQGRVARVHKHGGQPGKGAAVGLGV